MEIELKIEIDRVNVVKPAVTSYFVRCTEGMHWNCLLESMCIGTGTWVFACMPYMPVYTCACNVACHRPTFWHGLLQWYLVISLWRLEIGANYFLNDSQSNFLKEKATKENLLFLCLQIWFHFSLPFFSIALWNFCPLSAETERGLKV